MVLLMLFQGWVQSEDVSSGHPAAPTASEGDTTPRAQIGEQ